MTPLCEYQDEWLCGLSLSTSDSADGNTVVFSQRPVSPGAACLAVCLWATRLTTRSPRIQRHTGGGHTVSRALSWSCAQESETQSWLTRSFPTAPCGDSGMAHFTITCSV